MVVTIKMIAERCGLSVSAVSKALNNQPGISAERAEQVRAVAKEMGYFPSAAARSLRTRHSKNLGLLYHNTMAHEFFSVVLDGIRQTAEKYQYDLTLLGNFSLDNVGYYEHAKHRSCDGVIVAQGDFDQNSLQHLITSDLPVVSVEQIYPGRTAIMNENIHSMEQIVAWLHSQGHTRIAFIHGELGGPTHQRLQGFRQGCKKCGIHLPESYIIQGHYHEPQYAGPATRQLLDLPQPPTCILYPDDMAALGGLAEIAARGLRIPEDISCFGYDGIQLASLIHPSLATYKQNAFEMGSLAAMEIISAIEDPDHYRPSIRCVSGNIQPGNSVRALNKE